MKRTLMLIVIATLAVFGQKIGTQNPDRSKITAAGYHPKPSQRD
ncbi:MAG: hypothetical protein AAB403_05475 [Planctomycetota bacterium]